MALRNLLREPLRKFKPYVVGKSIDDVRREYRTHRTHRQAGLQREPARQFAAGGGGDAAGRRGRLALSG